MELQAIRRHWQSLGVRIREGVSDQDIAGFEQRYAVRLPEAVRRFYQFIDGMDYGSCDEELISFWPLSEVAPVPQKVAPFRGIPDYGGIESSLPEANSYFAFADHSLWVYVYAVRLSADPAFSAPVVSIAGGNCWQPLASSFVEFLQRYGADPRSVLFP
jgi:hypothetical protein